MAVDIPPKFVDLWTASTRVGSEVNIIGVVSDSLPSRKSSGTDWTCTFCMADRSYGSIGDIGQEGLKTRFFKKMQSELPQIWGTGDVLILRNMKITKFNGVTLAISSFGSTWTVLHAPTIPEKVPSNLVQIAHEKETRAPLPTPSEMQYVIDICNNFDRNCFASKGSSTVGPAEQMNNVARTTTIVPRQKFSLIKDVQIDTFYDLVGQVVKIFPSNGRTDLYVTDYTPNQLLYFYEWGQGEDSLDGRDGDEFGYVSRSSKKKWPGPFGKLTLAVTLWSPHSDYAQQHVKEGHFVFLRNVHIRLDKDTKMNGSLHSDQRYADQINISVLTSFHDDDRVKDVLRRKTDYHKKFDQQSEKYVIEAREANVTESRDANVTEREDVKQPSKAQIKKKRRRNKKAQLIQSNSTDKASAKRKHSEDAENELPASSGSTAARNTPNTSPRPQKAPKLQSKAALNENINCSHHLVPITPLGTILSLDAHINKTPKGETYTLPFQNINSRAAVRVIDFWPPHLEDFAVPKRKRSEYAVLSDYEDSDSDSTGKNTTHSSSQEQEYEWRFALLLSDATSPSCSSQPPTPTLKAYISGPDAECLLKLDAENLHASPAALAALREKLFLLWGNLEEQKMKSLEVENSALKEIDGNEHGTGKRRGAVARGRPFQCCLKEYGVKVWREEGGSVSRDDGDPRLWERRWRMWGCTIV